MWSSCPCVSTTPRSGRRACARSRSRAAPGRCPACRPTGTTGPTSTIRMRPSSSTQAMLRPTSPTPPRKTTRQSLGVQRRPASSSALRTRGRSSLVAGTSGSRGTPAGRPSIVQGGLDRDRVRGDEQRVEQRRELLVDLAGRGHVARADQLEHLMDLRADEVARDAHDPDGAETGVAERRPVVARVDLEAARRLGDQSRDRLEVAGRVLDRHDVGALGEREERVVLDPRRGAARDVVDDDRQLGRVGHALEVRDQAALRAACCSRA